MALLYTESHEWIAAEGKARRAGITDFAQQQLGDIVFAECVAELGEELAKGDEVCVIESCKATASVYAPVAGKVIAFNDELEAAPELVNASATGEGWLFEIEPSLGETHDLMDEDAYAKYCTEA